MLMFVDMAAEEYNAFFYTLVSTVSNAHSLLHSALPSLTFDKAREKAYAEVP